MKFIAILLVISAVFLMSESGIRISTGFTPKDNCCGAMCSKHGQKNPHKKSCEDGLCNRVFSCSRCAFFIHTFAKAENTFTFTTNALVFFDRVAAPSDYAYSDWHPPKV